MTKTIFLGIAMTAAFMAGLLLLIPIQQAIAPPMLGEDQTERDNTTVTHIEVEDPQKLILVDNRGIVGTGLVSGTSDVEVTWRFDPEECRVEWLPLGLDPSDGGDWVPFANDGAFGVFAAHDDALNVEAVALSAKEDKCKLDPGHGEFVTVSTVASSP